MKKKSRGKSPLKRIVIGVCSALGVVVAAVAVLLLVLTVTEFKPKDVEELAVSGSYSKELGTGDTITVMSWNIGYGALGDNADFFMDGGTHVITATTERVMENLDGIGAFIQSENPDLVLLQEVDTDSKRSHNIDEQQALLDQLSGYQNSYAYNYKVLYIPYPLPTMGKVECGLSTLSSYEISSSKRIALPCPFSYPLRLCNLKRCLMVDRIPIKGSDKELVLVNLHLEAYDSGEGKAAQTAMLRELLEEEAAAGNYVIAGGDFNQVFSDVDTSSYPLVNEDMWKPGVIETDEFPGELHCLMDNSLPSCRSLDQPYADADKDNFQYYIIDGFIVSDNLTVEALETTDLQFVYSDHNPLMLTVTLQ